MVVTKTRLGNSKEEITNSYPFTMVRYVGQLPTEEMKLPGGKADEIIGKQIVFTICLRP